MSIGLVALLLLGIGGVAAYAISNECASDSTGVWTCISDTYYTPVSIGESNQILLRKTLQGNDYAQILEKMVDTSIPADTAAIERVLNDPEAHLPDNMLLDGRVLRSDWQLVQRELIAEAQDTVIILTVGAHRLSFLRMIS